MIRNRGNADHYTWGADCDGWHLLNHPEISVIEERVTPGASETPHRHAEARQLFYVLSGNVDMDIDDRTFAVYRLADGELVATSGFCSHGRAHLADGTIVGCTVECPKHNGRFDLRTGEAVRKPASQPIEVFTVRAVGGRLVAQ